MRFTNGPGDQIWEMDVGLFGSWFSFLIGRLGCREDAGVTETG